MRAHRLRERITIQQPVVSRDDAGDEILAWDDHYSCWAGVEPVRGAEAWAGLQESATQNIRVVVRWNASIASVTPKMRIDHNGNYYDIHSVINPDNRNVEGVLMCTWRQLPDIYP